jgi:hypothetical protein
MFTKTKKKWVLYPVMKARDQGDSHGITLEEEINRFC